MTDAELVRACAEKIMGWELGRHDGFEFVVNGGRALVCILGEPSREWNPLTDEADCAAVREKMGSDGFRAMLTCDMAGATSIWSAFFEHAHRLEQGEASDVDFKRAVVLATLAAKGVAVEE